MRTATRFTFTTTEVIDDSGKAIPLLRVADVERSTVWCRDTLGFSVDAFPDSPPHVFAILTLGPAQLMLRLSEFTRAPEWEDWDVRIPLVAGLHELYARLAPMGIVVRQLERMPYCDAEFDVRDPDGYIICFSEMLKDATCRCGSIEVNGGGSVKRGTFIETQRRILRRTVGAGHGNLDNASTLVEVRAAKVNLASSRRTLSATE